MKQKKKEIRYAAIFILIPLLSCTIYSAIQGLTLWQISPFTSLWNDEIFYYKQIEGIVNSGAPFGYFGYNGSSADVGTLGAWSPFLLYPYALIGKFFGTTPHLLLICNILFITIAFAVFYFLAKPNLAQIILIASLFLAAPIFTRYISSFMAEPLLFAAVIVFAGFTIHFQNSDYTRKSIYIFCILAIYFSLCRPWLLIFLIIPAYYLFKKSRLESVVMFLGSVLVFTFIYIFYVLPRCAAYFSPIINTTMFTVFKNQGFFEFIGYTFFTVFNAIKSIVKAMLFGITNPTDISSSYYLFFILGLILTVYLIYSLMKKPKENHKHIVTCFGIISIMAIVLLTVIVFYTYKQGSRHLLSLCIFAGFIICMQYMPKSKLQIALIMLFIGIFGWSISSYEYIFKLPNNIEQSIIMSEVSKLSTAFTASPNNDNWGNTVAYIYPNVNPNYCYFLPNGAGINLHLEDYLYENFCNIKSKYILTSYDENKVNLYKNSGWELLTQGKDFVMYQNIMQK